MRSVDLRFDAVVSEPSLEMVRLRGLSFRPTAMPLRTAPGGIGEIVEVVVSSTPSPESLDDVLRVSCDEHVDEADETVDADFGGGFRDSVDDAEDDDVEAAGEEAAAAAAATGLICATGGGDASDSTSSLAKQVRSESISWSAVSLSTKSSHE